MLEPLEERRPWDARDDDPAAVDMHFWDWILWLGAKGVAGRRDLVGAELEKMHRHLLGPLGVAAVPRSVEEAVERYARAAERLDWRIPPTLSREVHAGLRQAGYHV